MIKAISTEAELRGVLEEAKVGDKLVVLLFLTNWCGSAVKVARNVAEFSVKYENVIFAKIDCDEAERALTEGIEALPFFRFYRAGEVIESVQGAVPSALEQLIQAHTLVVERL